MYELATGEAMFKNLSEFDMIKQFENGLTGFSLDGYSEDFEDFLMCSLQI